MKKLIMYSLALLMMGCAPKKSEIEFPYKASDFEKTIDGKPTKLFTLKNKNGMVVTLTNYGAKIVSIYTEGKNGDFADVMLGFKSVDDYVKYGASHGATVGPYANRIGGANFIIDDVTYELEKNNGENTLHSGPDSFYRKVWDASQNENRVEMKLLSADGEYGFPGNKQIKVVFTLTENNELRIEYEATTDKPTHINLTNHGYFNLRGEGNGNILDHVVFINADCITPVDETMIPTGEFLPVKGTPLDFTTPHPIGERIDNDYPLLKIGSGYDFNYVINHKKEGELTFAASAYEPESGRYMEVFTTEPGVQLYTGNHLGGNEIGKNNIAYGKRTGFCFETQHFPDTPNKLEFPTTLVVPGEVFTSTTVYNFSWK